MTSHFSLPLQHSNNQGVSIVIMKAKCPSVLGRLFCYNYSAEYLEKYIYAIIDLFVEPVSLLHHECHPPPVVVVVTAVRCLGISLPHNFQVLASYNENPSKYYRTPYRRIVTMESSSSPLLLPFPHHQEESRAVEDAIQNALQLIRTYSEDPSDWRDRPEQIYQSLDVARNQLTIAWQNLQTAVSMSVEEEGSTSSTEQEIRVAFVDMITDAFADVLQHQRDTTFDVSTLVDCLQSGLDMMNITSVSELAWYDDDLSDGEDEEGGAADSSPLTPHEQRRRAMGFPVPEETAA
jgi:hypothetical protein